MRHRNMAIDSKEKRMSVVPIGAMYLAPSLVPDGDIRPVDRRAIGYSYRYHIAAIDFVVNEIVQAIASVSIEQPAAIVRSVAGLLPSRYEEGRK